MWTSIYPFPKKTKYRPHMYDNVNLLLFHKHVLGVVLIKIADLLVVNIINCLFFLHQFMIHVIIINKINDPCILHNKRFIYYKLFLYYIEVCYRSGRRSYPCTRLLELSRSMLAVIRYRQDVSRCFFFEL